MFCNMEVIFIPIVIGGFAFVGMWHFPRKWITSSRSGNLERILSGTPVRWVWLNSWGKALYIMAYSSIFFALGSVVIVEYFINSGSCF